MSSEDRLAHLEQKVQYLTDRQEILDCIARNSRGNDRFDAERTSSSYHLDGFHELGQKQISGSAYGEHANQAHAAICEANLHDVTMHAIKCRGDAERSAGRGGRSTTVQRPGFPPGAA